MPAIGPLGSSTPDFPLQPSWNQAQKEADALRAEIDDLFDKAIEDQGGFPYHTPPGQVVKELINGKGGIDDLIKSLDQLLPKLKELANSGNAAAKTEVEQLTNARDILQSGAQAAEHLNDGNRTHDDQALETLMTAIVQAQNAL